MDISKQHIQRALVEVINTRYSPGDKVQVRLDNGNVATWTLKAIATLLDGHRAVIWVHEHPSCYAAERLLMDSKEIISVLFYHPSTKKQ